MLDVSVTVAVPEQSLITITPEELLVSDVLIIVLGWPFFIGQMLLVLSVLSVVQFNVDDWDSGQDNGWNGNKVGDLLP